MGITFRIMTKLMKKKVSNNNTSGSCNVILTHTSTVEDDVTKKFWDRLAGIYKNLELLNN